MTGFPTSADMYLEMDGKKVAVVQSYTCLLYTSRTCNRCYCTIIRW